MPSFRPLLAPVPRLRFRTDRHTDRQTDRQTHTQDNYRNPPAHARRGLTTVQCSICSQLNNKPRVYIVVTDFRLHHTCSTIILWLHSLSGVIRSLLCNPCAFSPGILIISVCENTPTFMSTCTSYVHTHIYIADMCTKKVSKCAVTSERSVFS